MDDPLEWQPRGKIMMIFLEHGMQVALGVGPPKVPSWKLGMGHDGSKLSILPQGGSSKLNHMKITWKSHEHFTRFFCSHMDPWLTWALCWCTEIRRTTSLCMWRWQCSSLWCRNLLSLSLDFGDLWSLVAIWIFGYHWYLDIWISWINQFGLLCSPIVVTYITKRYQEISVVFPIQPFNLTCELGAEPLFGRTEIDRKVLKMIHPQIQSGLLGFAASCVWFGTPLMWEGLPTIQWSKAMYKLDNVHAQIESYVADVVRSDLWGAEMFFFSHLSGIWYYL